MMLLNVVWVPEPAELEGDVVRVDHAIGLDIDPPKQASDSLVRAVKAGTAGYGKGRVGHGRGASGSALRSGR